LADLKEIGRWIAEDNPSGARRFIKELTDASMSLERLPRRFPLVFPSGEPPVRKRAHRGYLIFYRVEPESVQIIRIGHGSRDWVTVLGEME
jgi:plasmid stabilization system protein ParE